MAERGAGTARRGTGTICRIVLLLVVLLSCFHTFRGEVAEGSLRVVMDDNYPPYVFRNERGELEGILPDEWRLWQERTGRAVEIVGMNWGDAMACMASGDFDVIDTIFFNEARAKIYDFTKSYARIDVPIFFHRNISGIVDVSSLRGFRVAAKRGDNAVDVLRRSGVENVVEYDSYEQIIRAARDGKVVVFVVDRPPALHFLYKFGVQDQFRTAAPLPGGEFHRAVRKGDAATLALVQEGFDRISAEEHRRIERKWYGAPLVEREWVRIFLLGAASAAALMLALALWSWSLRRIVRRKTAELEAQIRIAEEGAEALRRSEERYRLLVENVSEGIAVQQGNRFRFVNSAMTAISGWSRDELMALDPILLVHPEDRGIVEEHYSRRMRGDADVPSRYDFRVIGKGGSPIWITVCVVTIEWEGKPATLDFYADITERKTAEERLAKSERYHRALIDASNDAIFVHDAASGTVVDLNSRFVEMYGYPREAFARVAFEKLNEGKFPYSLKDAQRWIRKASEEGPQLFEWRARRADGSLFWVEVALRFVRIDEKNLVLAAVRDISDRKRVEEALAGERRVLDDVIELNPLSIQIVDRDGFTVRVNAAFLDLFGAVPPPGYSVFDDPILRRFGYDAPMRRLREGEVISLPDFLYNTRELSIALPDRPLWLHVVGFPIRDETGQIRHCVLMHENVTERKATEDRLRDSEERYRQLYDAESDAIFLIDNEEGRIVEANPTAEALYGYSREELLSLRNVDLSAEPDATRNVTRHGASLVPLRFHRKKDGTIFPVEITGRFFSWRGRAVHIAAIRDISARIRADEDLRESEERLRFVLEGSKLGFWDWNLVTGTVTRNREWAEMLGYPFEEAQSSVMQWENVVHPDDIPAAWRSIQDHLEGRTPIHAMEYRIRTKDGRYKWILDRARVMARDAEGKALRMCGTHTDITERKEAEEHMRYLSYHDVLTDLRNRASFEEEMRKLDARQHGPVGIFVFDVDGLKLVNDTFGHDQGDLLLRNAAQTIGDVLRNVTVARIGGDEFGAILPGAGEQEMEEARGRILVGVENRAIDVQDIHVPLHLAIGYAISSGPEVAMREAFRIADDRMYRDKLHRRGSARGAIVQILKQMLAERDFITEGHGERLSAYALALGRALGMSEAELPDLRLFAQFHDIGKVGIPDRILQKPGPLSPEERNEMQRHAEVGQRIAQSSPELAPIAEWILLHHEWWNGGGYPLGLSGERIPLPCRVLAIVDAFDAMTSDRPYRKAMSKESAVAELRRGSGTQFEPRLVEIFVNLSDERLAIGDSKEE